MTIRINGTVQCIVDDTTFLDIGSIMVTTGYQINDGYGRAIGGCILRALKTSDEALIPDDKSIRRSNLAYIV